MIVSGKWNRYCSSAEPVSREWVSQSWAVVMRSLWCSEQSNISQDSDSILLLYSARIHNRQVITLHAADRHHLQSLPANTDRLVSVSKWINPLWTFLALPKRQNLRATASGGSLNERAAVAQTLALLLHRRRAGEIPAWGHCLNVDTTISADHFSKRTHFSASSSLWLRGVCSPH